MKYRVKCSTGHIIDLTKPDQRELYRSLPRPPDFDDLTEAESCAFILRLQGYTVTITQVEEQSK